MPQLGHLLAYHLPQGWLEVAGKVQRGIFPPQHLAHAALLAVCRRNEHVIEWQRHQHAHVPAKWLLN